MEKLQGVKSGDLGGALSWFIIMNSYPKLLI
jgi:hypothetical protein